MTMIIGSGLLKDYTKELTIQHPIKVKDIPQMLDMRDSLSNLLIVVRNHHRLSDEEFIYSDDKVYLFLAVMGG